MNLGFVEQLASSLIQEPGNPSERGQLLIVRVICYLWVLNEEKIPCHWYPSLRSDGESRPPLSEAELPVSEEVLALEERQKTLRYDTFEHLPH